MKEEPEKPDDAGTSKKKPDPKQKLKLVSGSKKQNYSYEERQKDYALDTGSEEKS